MFIQGLQASPHKAKAHAVATDTRQAAAAEPKRMNTIELNKWIPSIKKSPHFHIMENPYQKNELKQRLII